MILTARMHVSTLMHSQRPTGLRQDSIHSPFEGIMCNHKNSNSLRKPVFY